MYHAHRYSVTLEVRMNHPCGMMIVVAFLFAPFPALREKLSQQQPIAPSQRQAGPGSVQDTNDAFVQKILKQITGHEREPAEEVFKNVHIMKATPAARFLTIMNLGYSRALGVTCTHCHVEQDFSSDDKRPKPNSRGHFINCSTCHRGAVDPLKAEQ